MSSREVVRFRIHTLASAPEKSRHALEVLDKDFGFIPNVAGAMAESPVLLDAFVGVFEQFHAGSFSEPERQVLLLTNAVANACPWAVALHTALALAVGVAEEDVRALRDGALPGAPKSAALSALARALIETRGQVPERELAAFTSAGFGNHHVLEVILAVVGSTFTNYTANVAHPTVEDRFARHAWQPPRKA
jgi:AhpD family alkylhydroperoxidase